VDAVRPSIELGRGSEAEAEVVVAVARVPVIAVGGAAVPGGVLKLLLSNLCKFG